MSEEQAQKLDKVMVILAHPDDPPDIVITCDPMLIYSRSGWINHPDHRAAGQITLDAIFPGVDNRMYHTELLAEGSEPHQVREIYIAGAVEPDTVVDVTDTCDAKIKALLQHKSQIKKPERLKERLRKAMTDNGTIVERFKRLSKSG